MSEAVETSYGQLSVMESGEFAGWRYWQGDPFETRSGPFYYRREEDGSYVSAFRAEPRHMNGGGFMHGGCLLTFADFALFAIATDELNGDHAVTLNLAGDFLGSVADGALVEARGRSRAGAARRSSCAGSSPATASPR